MTAVALATGPVIRVVFRRKRRDESNLATVENIQIIFSRNWHLTFRVRTSQRGLRDKVDVRSIFTDANDALYFTTGCKVDRLSGFEVKHIQIPSLGEEDLRPIATRRLILTSTTNRFVDLDRTGGGLVSILPNKQSRHTGWVFRGHFRIQVRPDDARPIGRDHLTKMTVADSQDLGFFFFGFITHRSERSVDFLLAIRQDIHR